MVERVEKVHECCPEEQRKFAMEAEKFKAEARKMNAEASKSELLLSQAERQDREELAKDKHHKVYVFDSEVAAASVKMCIQQLTTWSRQDPGCEIEIQVNSPGGSIFAGFALIDAVRMLRDKDHKITMVAIGMAASMAGVILQAADVRAMGGNAFLLIHQGSLIALGDFGQVEDRVKLMELMHERILALFEERAKPINPKTTKAYIKKHWHRKDWWLAAEDCLKLGLVDEVR